jgi:hypothetical protein
MAIRTYALYGCSRCLLALMTIIIIALVGVACVRVCTKIWTLYITNDT